MEKINTENETDAFSPKYWEVDKNFMTDDFTSPIIDQVNSIKYNKTNHSQQIKKEDNLSLGSHLETQSKAEEENKQRDKSDHVDNQSVGNTKIIKQIQLLEKIFPCCKGECDCHIFLEGSGKECPTCVSNLNKESSE